MSNEDAVLAGPVVFAVADGMGGHAAGEVASSIAIAHLAEVGASGFGEPADVLDVLDAANREILHRSARSDQLGGMGTTVAGVAMLGPGHDHQVVAFNVGDSRIYRMRGGGLQQVSEDHSVVGELVRSGDLTAEEAAVHPERHVVTRALGIAEDAGADVWLLDAHPGDRYLICSDGLTGELDLERLEQGLLGAAGQPQRGVDDLLGAALERGARDNVSLVVVEIVAVNASTPDDDETNPRISDDTNPKEVAR